MKRYWWESNVEDLFLFDSTNSYSQPSKKLKQDEQDHFLSWPLFSEDTSFLPLDEVYFTVPQREMYFTVPQEESASLPIAIEKDNDLTYSGQFSSLFLCNSPSPIDDEIVDVIKGLSDIVSTKIFYNQMFRKFSGLSPYPLDDVFDAVRFPLGDSNTQISIIPQRKDVEQFICSIVYARSLPVEVIVAAAIYINTLEAHSAVFVYSSNWRCILIASLLIATKFVGDFCVWNVDWIFSALPNMNIRHLNQLEYSFLVVMDYKLVIPPSAYTRSYKDLRAAQTLV